MKIEKRKNQKKATIVGLISILLLTISYLSFAYASQSWWPFKKDPVTSDQLQNESTNSSVNANEDGTPTPNDPNDPEKTPSQYDEPGTSKNNPAINGVINYKSVVNGTLLIRTTITQKLSGGTCALKLTHETTRKNVERTAEIATNPSSATCKGFDILTSDLDTGLWNIVITVNSNGKTGKITGQVSI